MKCWSSQFFPFLFNYALILFGNFNIDGSFIRRGTLNKLECVRLHNFMAASPVNLCISILYHSLSIISINSQANHNTTKTNFAVQLQL